VHAHEASRRVPVLELTMPRGPEPQPGGTRERRVLGVMLLLAGALFAALGSRWGWLAVAAGLLLIVTSASPVEDATAATPTRPPPPDATPIEPQDGVNLRGLLPIAFAVVVLWFKFHGIALFALRAALASTDYLPLEVREPAPPPLRHGDLVLVRREDTPALVPGRVIAFEFGDGLVLARLRRVGPDTVRSIRIVHGVVPGGIRPLDPRRRTSRGVALGGSEIAVEWPSVSTSSVQPAADPPTLVLPRDRVHGPVVAVVLPVHRWRVLR